MWEKPGSPKQIFEVCLGREVLWQHETKWTKLFNFWATPESAWHALDQSLPLLLEPRFAPFREWSPWFWLKGQTQDTGICVMTQWHWSKALTAVTLQVLLPKSHPDATLVHDSSNVCVSFVARSIQQCRCIWKLGFISSEPRISSTTWTYLGWKENLS